MTRAELAELIYATAFLQRESGWMWLQWRELPPSEQGRWLHVADAVLERMGER